jgi:hypothetical protein
LIKIHSGTQIYCMSPQWLSARNNFSSSTPLVYGGFCFSFLGGWASTLGPAAGVYIGVDWTVRSNWHRDWAKNLFDNMTDTSLAEPLTVGDWFTTSTGIDKQYWEPRDDKWVHLAYNGHSNLALWQGPCDDFPPPPGETTTYRVVGTPYTFTTVTESVEELVNGYRVIRVRRTDNPPNLGEYGGCDPVHGLVEVATDWWDLYDPSEHGRHYWEPPLFGCPFGAPAGSTCTWSGTFADAPAWETNQVVGYGSITVPYGTFPNVMKVMVTGSEDDPMYAWVDATIGVVRAEMVDDPEDAIELVAYQPPPAQANSKVQGQAGSPVMVRTRLIRSMLREAARARHATH